jgi:hypothetical protein
METLVAFTLAEMAIVALQLQAQEILIQRWKRGELSLEQLRQLKSRHWFQRRMLRPPNKPVSRSKKED